MAYDLSKAVLIQGYDANGKWNDRAKKIMDLEECKAHQLSYEFDLGDKHGRLKVTFYGTNMLFYQRKTVISAKSIMQRLEGTAIAAEFRARNIDITPDTTPTKLLDALLKAGALPTRRKISAEYAREHLAYKQDGDALQEWEDWRLTNIGLARYADLRFVTSQRNNSGTNDETMWLLVSEEHEDALLALCLIYYTPGCAVIYYLASLHKGACKRISSLLARNLLVRNRNQVTIHSISEASHMCYLKSFLGGYKYGVMSLNDYNRDTALIDMSTLDAWWAQYADEKKTETNPFNMHVYMTFLHDDNTLINLAEREATEGALSNVFGDNYSTIHVYVQVTAGVKRIIDEFMSSRRSATRRVMHISAADLRAKYSAKRQKLSEDEDDIDL
jgi:hypothetical protein